MSDASRDRPQYGEYATAEEQAARIRQPDASEALEAGIAPAAAAPRQRAIAAPDTRRTADRVITIGLLAYGLLSVILTAISLTDFPTLATSSMNMAGIPGEFTNDASGRLFGAIAAVSLAVGWTITCVASVRRLRARRATWWVPLVGAVVTHAVVFALLIPPILGDPAFQEYVRAAAS